MPLFIGINTPFSYRKLWKSYTIFFFIRVYIFFIYLIKSSLTQYYSILLLYLLSLQCAMRCNKNPFRSYSLVFVKLSISLFYVFRLMSFLYFFRQVDAIIVDIYTCIQWPVGGKSRFIQSSCRTVAASFVEVELTGYCISKVGRILVYRILQICRQKGKQFELQLMYFGHRLTYFRY